MLWTNKLPRLSLESIFSRTLCLQVRAKAFSKSAALESVENLKRQTLQLICQQY
jgi:hypothetical protein